MYAYIIYRIMQIFDNLTPQFAAPQCIDRAWDLMASAMLYERPKPPALASKR
jgi:hypothetical protein